MLADRAHGNKLVYADQLFGLGKTILVEICGCWQLVSLRPCLVRAWWNHFCDIFQYAKLPEAESAPAVSSKTLENLQNRLIFYFKGKSIRQKKLYKQNANPSIGL